MTDGALVAMDEFWKERVGRELNRLSMPDATGELSAPGTPRKLTPRLSYGIAGTQMSARFHARFQNAYRSPEAGILATPRYAWTSGMTPRQSRSVVTTTSRGGRSAYRDDLYSTLDYGPQVTHMAESSVATSAAMDPRDPLEFSSYAYTSRRRPTSSRASSRPGSRGMYYSRPVSSALGYY